MKGVEAFFLLNAVTADEATRALLALDLAREAGVRGIVYFSVLNSARFEDVPHFASKHLAERAIDAKGIPATVLRASYFMQNDLMFRDALKAGFYPQPIGSVGIAMVDVRDIADAAAAELMRREQSPHPLPRTTIDVVGPDTVTGTDIAAIWTSILGREVRYGGDDLDAFEDQAAQMIPGWITHEMRVMLRAFQRFGIVPGVDARATVEGVIGHPLRTYRAFARRPRRSGDDPGVRG